MTHDFLKEPERAEKGPAGRPVPAEEAVPVFLPEDGKGLPDEKERAAAKEKRHRRRMRALRSFLLRLVCLVLVVYFLFFHLVGLTIMPSRDMYPRLDAGDLLLFSTQRFVCRVIAAPGDTVEVSEERGLAVNGNAVIETNIFYPTRPYEEGTTVYPLVLGEGEYFVLADQRNGGMDSRYFGIVKAEEIRGIVITVLRRNNL